MRGSATVALLLFGALPAVPCSCVYPVGTTAKTQLSDAAVALRGSVVDRKTLPRRPDMRRGRYAITFRVDEYWKGSPSKTIVVYGVDPGTDCEGWGDVEIGKAYLIYAREQKVEDIFLADRLWIGWKDVLPEGTKMLVPVECSPSGEVSQVGWALKELGTGKRVP